MRWILLDVAIALTALALLALVLLRLWRKTKALGSAVARAGEQVAQATALLEQVQPPPARPPVPDARRRPTAGRPRRR